MAKGDKFGSPYDPRNFGKIPPEQQPVSRREPEVEKLGPGCGNPYCPQCYPQNAGIPGRNRPFPEGMSVPPELRGRTPDVAVPRDIVGPFDRSPEEQQRMMEAAARARAEQEAMRVMRERGIVDPNMLRPSAIFRVPAGPGRSPVEDVLRTYEEIREAIYRTPPPPPKREPPDSYKKAREEVEDFILKADKQSFTDIVGNEEALEGLVDAVEAPVKYGELYKAYGMKMPKGAVLTGPPGCGKTMFARAAATKFIELYGDGVEFVSIQSTDIQSMWVGVTERHIRNIFEFGREYQAYHGHPLLVFIDEAEVLFPDRTGRTRRVTPWEESQVSTFLAEMDGVRESCVFMLLATNRIEVMDSALLRDGRCDFKIKVKRPTRENAEIILRKNFTHTLVKGDREELVMHAVESLYAPHYIINSAAQIEANLEKQEIKIVARRDFLLEDIVSGAMLASIPNRATRHAFARDKKSGEITGVLVEDVLKAVQDIFEENEGLDHPYAQREFMEKFAADLEEKK